MKLKDSNSLEAIHGGCGEAAYVISTIGAIASVATLNGPALAACWALSISAAARCNHW